MKYKSLIIILGIILCIGLVDAASFNFKQNQEVNHRFRCFTTTGAYCTSGTILVVSVEYDLNGSNILNNVSMTFNETFFNITLPTHTLGDYKAIISSPTSNNTVSEFTYKVTSTGFDLSSQQITIYIIGFMFIIILILFLFFIISALPSEDTKDERGVILQINQLKHLRPVLYVTIWGLLLALAFMISNIAVAYLNDNMLFNFLFMLYKVIFWMTVAMLPIYFIYLFSKIFKDKEYKRMMERGVELGGSF